MQVQAMVHEEIGQIPERSVGLDGWSEAVKVMLDRSPD
jgi:hypothetical protein